MRVSCVLVKPRWFRAVLGTKLLPSSERKYLGKSLSSYTNRLLLPLATPPTFSFSPSLQILDCNLTFGRDATSRASVCFTPTTRSSHFTRFAEKSLWKLKRQRKRERERERGGGRERERWRERERGVSGHDCMLER